MVTSLTLTSRAVIRPVDPGSMGDCAHCRQRVKFRARIKASQVICNVYEDGRWNRVEFFHHGPALYCYLDADEPHGPLEKPAA